MLSSPLRYPGGKAKLYDFFAELIKENDLYNSTYCEPFAGGAGLALKLLATGFVSRIALNDIDPAVYAFWRAVLDYTDEFCDLIENAKVTIEEWHIHKRSWLDQTNTDILKLGFSTFFLNRTNRSGIIEGAGPIGGYRQEGAWKIDVRFNKAQQIKNIQAIKTFRDRIDVYNEDALKFLRKIFDVAENFVYLDPPYYVKGSKLYRNFYNHNDHCDILYLLEKNRGARWVVSYDDVQQIRDIYRNFDPIMYELNYSAGRAATGKEVIYLSDSLTMPSCEKFVKLSAA
ncbi:DNA adenine methylase [Brucella sp. IR073]|uniref:DNA adenine methylase n=1 Tax=unclassified Brucella TaxID=2632610 RepID=UPI003B9833CC